jgi:Polyketide cyclase / dehydrase and lipid transport
MAGEIDGQRKDRGEEVTMTGTAWEKSHSVDTSATVDFAWTYWTDVSNWDDPPARFELEGAFAAGARGVTHLPGQAPILWFIRNVTPGEAATIEIPVNGAAMSFEWRFAPLAGGRTRITQRVALRGEKSDAYLEHAKIFAANLPEGMKKMAAAIARAAVRGPSSSGALG